MPAKPSRSGQKIAVASLLTVLALLVSSWLWRGYEPRLRIKGQPLKALSFSPAGDVLAVGSLAGGGSFLGAPTTPIRFLSARDGTEAQPTLPTTNQYPVSVVQAGYSSDGKLFATLQAHAYRELELAVFDLATRTLIGAQKVPYVDNVGSGPDGTVTFRFSPDSSFLVTDGQVTRQRFFSHRAVVVWDLAARKERFTLEKAGFPEISPDSRLLATIDDPPPNVYGTKGSLKLWNTQSGKLERAIELPGAARVWPAFSTDGKLVTVNTGDTAEVFETATGKRVFEQKGWTPRFLADGKTLMTVWWLDVQMWNTATWEMKQKHTFNLGRSWENGDPIAPRPQVISAQPRVAVFHSDPTRHWALLRWLGRTAKLNAFGSHRMMVIDAATGTRQSIELHGANLLSGSVWSPDGTRAALGFMDGSVELWDFPPRRSLVAPATAAVLAVVTVLALRRRKQRDPAANSG